MAVCRIKLLVRALGDVIRLGTVATRKVRWVVWILEGNASAWSSISQTGSPGGVSGVPRNWNAYLRKRSIGGLKFVLEIEIHLATFGTNHYANDSKQTVHHCLNPASFIHVQSAGIPRTERSCHTIIVQNLTEISSSVSGLQATHAIHGLTAIPVNATHLPTCFCFDSSSPNIHVDTARNTSVNY